MKGRRARPLVGGLLIAVVAIATTAVGIGAAGASTTSAGEIGPAADEYDGGANDRFVGTGHRLNLAGQPIKVHVDAKSGPNGEDARGTFQVSVETAELGTVTFRGRIHCLTVQGNRAAARGTIEKSTSPPNPVGGDYLIQVTDNKASNLPDTNINLFGFGPGDVGCPFFDIAEVPITTGNFKVRDAAG